MKTLCGFVLGVVVCVLCAPGPDIFSPHPVAEVVDVEFYNPNTTFNFRPWMLRQWSDGYAEWRQYNAADIAGVDFGDPEGWGPWVEVPEQVKKGR